MISKLTCLALAGLLLATSSATANEGFPGRDKYPDVPYYELDQLFDALDDVVVVDARSSLEFDTLRIAGAINIPVAAEDFETEVAKLRADTDKPIVFYCNGHKCMKSYIAVKKARQANVDNVFAYDAGVFDWVRAYPDKAVLLGESPVRTADLIPKKAFKSRMINADNFSDRATRPGGNPLVLDVRDKFQRAGVGFYPGKERWASLDDSAKLDRYIRQAIRQNRTLLIYDEVGKQVRWLQYKLEKAGVKDYYFMANGAQGYFEAMKNW